jgi:hypothetical protein
MAQARRSDRPVAGPQMRDCLALGGGPYHFFDRSSRSAAASSIASASSWTVLKTSPNRLLSDSLVPERGNLNR